MKFSLKEVHELFAALKSLDGFDSVVRVEGQPDRIVRESYFFDGEVRWVIANNLGVFKRTLEAYEEARLSLVKSLSKDGQPRILASEKEAYAKFLTEHERMLSAVVDLPGLSKLSKDSLNTGRNQIPGTVLLVLLALCS